MRPIQKNEGDNTQFSRRPSRILSCLPQIGAIQYRAAEGRGPCSAFSETLHDFTLFVLPMLCSWPDYGTGDGEQALNDQSCACLETKIEMKSHACSLKSVRFLLHARGVNQEVGKRRRTNFGALDLRTFSLLRRAGNEARRVELCALNLAVALYSCRSISIDLHGYITEHTRLPKMQLKHAVVICHDMMLCHMWKIME